MSGGFDEVEDFLETIRAAVVGVGNFSDRRVGSELQKQAHTVASMCRRSIVQDPQVFLVHGENEVEFLEVSGVDNPGTKGGHVVTATAGRLLGANVRRLTDVVAGRTGGIHFNLELGGLTRRNGA